MATSTKKPSATGAKAKPAPVPSVALKPLATARISDGGYTIQFSGAVPGGASVLLQVGSDVANLLDITGGYHNDQLDDLLELIDNAGAWGTTISCIAIILDAKGDVLAQSAATDLVCPVQPYDGALTFDAIGSTTPPLLYPGNGHGRICKPRKDGRYYFQNAGRLETNNMMRGFDCTTFPMSLFQNFPNMSGLYATALAVSLGATMCDMEARKENAIRAFFADSKRGAKGLYFMWSAGHVLLVKDAIIHEFTFGGYKKTPAATRPLTAPQGLWWIRKLPDSLEP